MGAEVVQRLEAMLDCSAAAGSSLASHSLQHDAWSALSSALRPMPGSSARSPFAQQEASGLTSWQQSEG